MQKPLSQAKRIGEADIVVGIPFYNESDTIESVLKIVRKGLEEFYPEQKCVIVAAGSPAGEKALEVINKIPQGRKISRIAFLLDDEGINGKGWAIRAIMEVARALGADLAIVEADLKSRDRNGEVEGLAQDWVKLLLEPVRNGEMDLVISRFNRHYFESPYETHVLYPLFSAIYNCPIHDLLGGQRGISRRLLQTYSQAYSDLQSKEVGGYGVDSWLATVAITSDARICEANLGIKMHRASTGKSELVLRHQAGVLFNQIVADKEWWREKGAIGELPLRQPLAAFGDKKAHQPDEAQIDPRQLVESYKRGFNKFPLLYQANLPKETYEHLEKLAEVKPGDFALSREMWVQIVYRYLLDFAFRTEFAESDLMDSFITLCEGCVASFTLEIQSLKAKLKRLLPDEAERMVSLEAESRIEALADEFLRQKPDFLAAWEEREEAFEPPVPNVTYREFIPGVPLVVPSELKTWDGKVLATANDIYNSIFSRYQQEFAKFVHGRLKVPTNANSSEIAARINDFMREVETQFDSILLPGDLSTFEGTQKMMDAVFRLFPHEDAFYLIPKMASWFLWQYPPSNLLTKLGYSNLIALLQDYEPSDVLAMANWSEEKEYSEQVLALVKETARPEHFEYQPLKPLVVLNEDFPSLAEMKEMGPLCKLTGRIVVSNLHKGMGGEFPKIHYLTHIAKNIVEVERFGKIWQGFAEARTDFGAKVLNSLEGHWGRQPLSAHNIFEDGNQRVLVERLLEMAQQITREAGEDTSRLSLAEHLKDVADSYHLAMTLSDGTFIPCSVWTWASYSFGGGMGLPTPLSLHVERDWASREFLTEYYKKSGGTEAAMEERIVELMEEGRESEDLAPMLLGGTEEAHEVILEQTINDKQPPAGDLVRFPGNPIFGAIKEHSWESKYVFNPGAIKLGGRVYLVYRASGEEGISRFGLAVSEGGFKFTERLEKPIFEPKGKSESKGCEDPRLTLMDERIYMAYTAYDGLVAQIVLASIRVNDFLNRRWGTWRRHGLVFPGFIDKDGALFPERFDDRFAMLHRVDPHIWITFSSHLRGPWPRKEHRILTGAMSGMRWDGKKIGAGAQPLKTKYGWLLFTHGVDHAHVYRLGVMLLDLTDPTVILYRSPNPILEPVEACEIGEEGKCMVHNVVFTCGAVPKEDNKDILGANDEVLVYYGAADTSICVASGKIGDLIPSDFLKISQRSPNKG
ncbi:glycosidase [Chloroflexota bacterium]